MAGVRWTLQAADDLESITDLIASDSGSYARLFASDIIRAVERLERFPSLGRLVPEANDAAIRELILGDYRVMYRVKPELVEILTVYHGNRLHNPDRLH